MSTQNNLSRLEYLVTLIEMQGNLNSSLNKSFTSMHCEIEANIQNSTELILQEIQKTFVNHQHVPALKDFYNLCEAYINKEKEDFISKLKALEQEKEAVDITLKQTIDFLSEKTKESENLIQEKDLNTQLYITTFDGLGGLKFASVKIPEHYLYDKRDIPSGVNFTKDELEQDKELRMQLQFYKTFKKQMTLCKMSIDDIGKMSGFKVFYKKYFSYNKKTFVDLQYQASMFKYYKYDIKSFFNHFTEKEEEIHNITQRLDELKQEIEYKGEKINHLSKAIQQLTISAKSTKAGSNNLSKEIQEVNDSQHISKQTNQQQLIDASKVVFEGYKTPASFARMELLYDSLLQVSPNAKNLGHLSPLSNLQSSMQLLEGVNQHQQKINEYQECLESMRSSIAQILSIAKKGVVLDFDKIDLDNTEITISNLISNNKHYNKQVEGAIKEETSATQNVEFKTIQSRQAQSFTQESISLILKSLDNDKNLPLVQPSSSYHSEAKRLKDLSQAISSKYKHVQKTKFKTKKDVYYKLNQNSRFDDEPSTPYKPSEGLSSSYEPSSLASTATTAAIIYSMS